ncbi:hypothetical protein BGW36DRAFT_9576 [Talaromyces proteolyticus]|uniref:Uncharacterized protein n=1 Tax=Talaromyces proteolyticus TaxID=1131652 RepID=A0AAD4L531_9EURO|nr:uncharacterized protein BGW36DRAFT_9576 [Talaromyces proteolyticus]KAH8705211.1 hypothetical protein BGW36DRAFT_9576 [Talaromyces proteolyticus]
MALFFQLLLCSWIFSWAFAGPVSLVAKSPESAPAHDITKRDIDPIRSAYRGIHWDDAYSQCTTDEFNILVESSRMALDVTSYKLGQYWDSPAWHRYFVRDWKTNPTYGWHGNERSQDTFLNIRNNIEQVSKFPREGRKDKRGNWSRSKQTSYRCQEIPNYNKCAKSPNKAGRWTGPSAYTAQPAANPDGWAVVFCPRFFQDGRAKYINRITDGTTKKPSDIGTLISYEYIVIHEWMHNKLFGYKFMIEDVKGNIPGQPDGRTIYGDTLCHEYAWINMGTSRVPGGGVNLMVAWNADNYAWFFNYNWYYYHWSWNDDGSHSYKRSLVDRDNDDDIITFDSTGGEVDEKDIDLSQDTIPINVHVEGADSHGTPMAVINYVGEDYDDFVKDSKESFVSPDSDCILSAECNLSDGNAIDPKCICKCDGEIASLEDPRCAGFAGSLPDPPKGGPGNGP